MNISKGYLSNNHNKKKPSGVISKSSSQSSKNKFRNIQYVASNNHKAATCTKAQNPPGATRHLAQSIKAKLCNMQLQVTIVKQHAQRLLQIRNSENFANEPRPLPWCSTEMNTQSHRREWKRTAIED